MNKDLISIFKTFPPQPGAEDGEVRAFVDSASDEQKNKVILGGPCILVQGETLAREKGKL